VQSAVDAALARQGEGAQVLFLKEASITVPRLRGTGYHARSAGPDAPKAGRRGVPEGC